MKVEIFNYNGYGDEDKINKFIQDKKVIDIKLSTSITIGECNEYIEHNIIMVMYENE